MSDSRDFSDATDESGLDDSKLNATFNTSPAPLEESSDEHNQFNISKISALSTEHSKNNSSIHSESSYINCETRQNTEALKKLLSEANDAHTCLLESEFMLKCCMDSMQKLPKETAIKMKEVLLKTKVQQLPRLKNKKTGESYSIFGLDEDDFNNTCDNETNVGTHHSSIAANKLSQLEKNAIKKAVQSVAKSKIAQLSECRNKTFDQLGSHIHRVAGQSGILSEDQERLQEMYRILPDKMAETVDQLISTNQLLQQLARPDRSGQELLNKTTSLARERAECLHSLTSYLRLNLDHQLLMDWKNVKSLNEEGDKLKADMAERDLELKSLQNKLDQFIALENSSPEFKELVTEYNKTKRILQHKRQTLSMFEASNDSFSK